MPDYEEESVMKLADEMGTVDELYRTGVLSEEEYARAKEAVLTFGDADAGKLPEVLAEVRCQIELDRIDREWEDERQQYMMTTRHGGRYLPTPLTAVIVLLAGGLFVFGGILPMVMQPAGPGGFGPLPAGKAVAIFAAVAVTAVTIYLTVLVVRRMEGYRRARAAYQARRAAAMTAHFR
jgi:hypothetical protein